MKQSLFNTVHNMDARKMANYFHNEIFIQTTITSPPYFDMKDYDSREVLCTLEGIDSSNSEVLGYYESPLMIKLEYSFLTVEETDVNVLRENYIN